MTPSERIFVTVFGLAFVSAVLSVPILGFAPLAAVASGAVLHAAGAQFVVRLGRRPASRARRSND